MDEEMTERLYVDIPLPLKRKIKAEAALRGMTQTEAVVQGMSAWCATVPATGGTGSPNTVNNQPGLGGSMPVGDAHNRDMERRDHASRRYAREPGFE